jgi:hypothetical protein
MKMHPLVWITGGYFLELVAVVYFTRAGTRRVAGALCGGVAVALMSLGMIAGCEALGWWRLPFVSTPGEVVLLGVGVVISCSPIYLVTWRIARRFGMRGLTLFTSIVTVIGSPRDYFIAARFPEWMVFSPGIAPIVADAVAYLGIVVLGHAVMFLVAGPSRADALARSVDPSSSTDLT